RPGGEARHQERAPPHGSVRARSRLSLPGLRRGLLAGVPPPSLPGGGDPRASPAVPAQPTLLREARGRGAPGDPRRRLRALGGGDAAGARRVGLSIASGPPVAVSSDYRTGAWQTK